MSCASALLDVQWWLNALGIALVLLLAVAICFLPLTQRPKGASKKGRGG